MWLRLRKHWSKKYFYWKVLPHHNARKYCCQLFDGRSRWHCLVVLWDDIDGEKALTRSCDPVKVLTIACWQFKTGSQNHKNCDDDDDNGDYDDNNDGDGDDDDDNNDGDDDDDANVKVLTGECVSRVWVRPRQRWRASDDPHTSAHILGAAQKSSFHDTLQLCNHHPPTCVVFFPFPMLSDAWSIFLVTMLQCRMLF